MTDEEIRITAATVDDLARIKELLTQNKLTTEGVDDHWRTFVIARSGETIIACGGAEAYQFAALIRSIAVDDAWRGRGIGRRLVRQLLDRLASRGLREFYLLTTTGEAYFRKRGFKTIDRDEVHPQLLASHELQGACPSDAVCMRLVMMT